MQVYSRQSRRSHRYDEVFVDSSANAIPSPRHTGRQHEIAVLGADFTPLPMAGYVYVRMSGETTMTKDFLNTDRPIAVPPAIRKGDYIVMFDMGAYGRATRSEFMNKPPDAVVLFRRDGALDKIVERGGYLDSVRHVLRQPIRL